MELKQGCANVVGQRGRCFNRTFMELKHNLRFVVVQRAFCFNRTFMELKQFQKELINSSLVF